MSARFVKFTDGTSGSPIGVNVDHVADVAEIAPGRTILFQDFCSGDDGPSNQAQLIVDGTLDEVLAVLNGEPTTPDEEWGPDSAAELLERGPR